MKNYERIENAINYITENYKTQPSLGEISSYIGLSPFHFQKLFKDWAGISPKKFLQYISLEHAKEILSAKGSVYDASYESGLSGTSRLHDLFIQIEAMTPGEYKKGGGSLKISWSNHLTPFGEAIIASTSIGICYMAFTEPGADSLTDLKNKYPEAQLREQEQAIHLSALRIFNDNPSGPDQLKLHLKGTDFQLKVWEALLKIPSGSLTTYSRIADSIGNPGASRAVGSSVGSNPVAFLIPCHRVIRSTGVLGDYRWGSSRKTAIIGWESAKISLDS